MSFKLGALLAGNERVLFQWIFLATGNLESRFKTKHKMLRMFKAVFLIIVCYVGVRSRTMPGPVFTSLAPGHSCSIAMHCPVTLPATITQYKKCGENLKCQTNADFTCGNISLIPTENWILEKNWQV